MRAKYIHDAAPIIRKKTSTLPVSSRPKISTDGSLPPKNLAVTMRRNRVGMLSMASVKRIKRLSIQPP